MTHFDDAVRAALKAEADRLLADAKARAPRPRGLWLPDGIEVAVPERDGVAVVYTITDMPPNPRQSEKGEHRPAELSPFVTRNDQSHL